VTDDASTPDRRRAAPERRPRWSLLAAVAAGVLALDQLSKWWVVENLSDGRIIDIVGSLRLRLTYNFGAAFSLSQGRGALISLLAVAVVIVLVVSGRQATRPLAAIALGMVLGGAIGNLSDRAFRDGEGFLGGGVVDFVDLQWWPVFNVADSGVVCGALLMVALSWFEDEPSDDDPDGDEGDAGTEPDDRDLAAGEAGAGAADSGAADPGGATSGAAGPSDESDGSDLTAPSGRPAR
jgi:signal peptidase II